MNLKATDFWYVLEQLIPFNLQRTLQDFKHESELHFSEIDENLPWLNEELLYSKYKLPIGLDEDEKPIRYCFRIYLGIFSQQYIFDFWKNLPKPVEPAFSDLVSSSKKLTCYFSFILNHDGFMVDDTLSNSSLPWAMKQLEEVFTQKKGRKPSLNAWTSRYDIFSEAIKGSYSSQTKLRNRMTVSSLQEVFEDLVKTDIPWMPPSFEYIAHYTIKRETKMSEDDSDILNSFYLNDIKKASNHLKLGTASEPLRQYLSANINDKVDVDNVAQLQHILSPQFLTLGRWPSPSKQHLALMQQCAVNLSFSQLENKGLFSVNGPPGTGKTTLLREIVAELVVQRASELIQFDNPSSAFRKSSRIHKLNKRITGFEIVLASSNNGAVENVTAELPSQKAVDDEFKQQFNYFQETAESIRIIRSKIQKEEKNLPTNEQNTVNIKVSPEPDSSENDKQAWGLIAAVLGKKRNCDKFCKGFWFRKENSINTALKKVIGLEEDEINPQLFKQEWDITKKDFLCLKRKIQSFIDARQEIYELSKIIEEFQNNISEIDSELSQLDKEIVQSQISLNHYTLQCSQTLTKINTKTQEILSERAKEQSLLSKIFSFQNKQNYIAKIQFLNSELVLLEKELEINNTILKNSSNRHEYLSSKQAKLSNDKAQYNDEIRRFEEGLLNITKEIGDGYISPKWWDKSREELHTSLPWLDHEINTLRTELFSLALQVHKNFLRCASKQVASNLNSWVDLVLGIDKSFSSSEALCLWQTLFLTVPVISTTFASVQRLFKNIESESFGWLLIDEAGQAVPQAVVGALQRSKRAIAVGDPLQIKPVFTVDEAVVRGLQNYFDIEDIWSPLKASVQTLSDRANPYGTYLQGQEEPLWIGCPLWVHRRCLNPMLEISNRIAYDGKMIMKTGEPDESKTFPLGESRWFDINGSCEGQHWVPAQGEKALSCLEQIVAEEKNWPSLFIISPFRAVAQEMKSLLRKEQNRWTDKLPIFEKSSRLSNWINKSVGTVHTFQGKEADTVILILGIDHKNQAGAQWAASEPNILNVAATRAKYRFYIIGSKKIWSSLRYFEEADKLLLTENKFS